MPKNGASTLSDLKVDTLTVGCTKCDRRSVVRRVADLAAEYGPDLRLPDLPCAVFKDCPKVGVANFYDRCGATFERVP